MTTIHLGTLSPTEDDNKIIDLKQVTFEVTPVDTVTPSLTPTSPTDGDNMAGKKLYSLEKPDDKARELASKLTLEEQVRKFGLISSALFVVGKFSTSGAIPSKPET